MQLFGTSGIRKIADRHLMQLALKVGLAIGSVYRDVVVGYDTRTSNQAIKNAAISGLLTAGASCCDCGIIPTPTLAFATREFSAGAMITASHNPPEYNGMKLFNPDGSAFDTYQRTQIEELVANDAYDAAPWEEIKQSTVSSRNVEQHITRILQDVPNRLKLRVVVDCGCGATSVITPYLLTRLGCEVIGLNCYPSGFFPHDVEPIEANLGDLMKATREFGAALGIAHDGDGDRMMVIDDRGRFITGDKLMVIFARELGATEIVTTVDASMAIDEMGFKTVRTMVGDIYVSEKLRKGGKFGGEPSGAWVFPGISLCPDGVYAAARIAAIASQQRLSTLVDNVREYPIFRGSVSSNGIVIPKLEQRLTAMNPTSVSSMDGIKLNFEDGWVLVRASGTEPKIRITAEAKSGPRLRHLYEHTLSIIRDCTEGI